MLCCVCREVLGDIFELCDLDSNGKLSRHEFNLFNVRTSGEEVEDDEWHVVEGQCLLMSLLTLNALKNTMNLHNHIPCFANSADY